MNEQTNTCTAFLIFETPFLEIVNKFEQQGYKDSIQQMVTTLYWLGPPTYKVDDDGNVDTIVSRVIEYVYNPDVADPNNNDLLPNNLQGVTEKLNSAGFAGSWNNVLEFYESVIIDLDPYDTYDKSQYRWSEAGYPTASIIEFEPADFIGAVKARWVFYINNTTNTDTTNTALQQLQNDLGGQLPTPALFDILYNDITSSPNPNQYPSNHNNNNNNGNKYVKKEKSQKEKSSKSSKKTKNRFWE